VRAVMPIPLPRTRADLIPLLEERGLRLSKRLGQNFLVDPQLADAIVRDAGVTSTDRVLEVGPGAGALTQPLLEAAAHVTSLELDRGLHALLEEALGDHPRFTGVHGDCLAGRGLHPCLVAALDAPRPAPERVLVVANLPYSVGTVVTVHLLTHPSPPDALVLMLQSEVVERLRAPVGTSDYGPLAVLVGTTTRVELLRRVPPDVFFPRPRIESSIVRLTPDPELRAAGGDVAALSRVLAIGFRHRRKTLQRNLKGCVDVSTLRELGLDPGARPERIAPEDWVRLAAVAQFEGLA